MATLNDKIDEILIDCERIHLPGGKWLDRKEAVDRIMSEIDKEQKKLRPALQWFAEIMEDNLKKNDFRGGWEDCLFSYLHGRAKANLKSVYQLQKNISKELYIPNRETLKEFIIRECVGCANFCMMIADNMMKESKGEEIK